MMPLQRRSVIGTAAYRSRPKLLTRACVHRRRLAPADSRSWSGADAPLTRSHLRGLERRAVDAFFRAVPVVALPGYRRLVIRVRDWSVRRSSKSRPC